jgi:hypothetical protein
MGHADDTIDEVYRQGIEDDRLRAVTGHVRQWLFGGKSDESTESSTSRVGAATHRTRPHLGSPEPKLRLFAS